MAGRSPVRKIVGRERVEALSRKHDLPGWLFFIGHLLVTLAGAALVWRTASGPWLWAALFIHGIVVVHWFAPLHEAIHGTVFRGKALNAVLAWFSGLVIGINPRHFALEHAAHHFHTNDPDRDPEMIASAETIAGYLWYATAIPYFIANGRLLLHYALGGGNAAERDFIPDDRLAWVQNGARIILAVYLLLAGFSWIFGSWAVALYWFLPRLLGEPVMRLIRMTEHVGRPRVRDMLDNTRTVEAWWLPRLLAWNMCYHIEHHALPSVPFHQLPALHKILKPHSGAISRNYWDAQHSLIRNGLANSARR